ncbi:MAG: heme-binding protein [Solirubrobacterales bacterium]|nr:heme-binding protein [Solirubrobacterales bacterium]
MASTFAKQSVSTELAHRLLEAGERHATQMGQAFVIAIVDESGVLKALSRMDGAPLLSVQVAQDKAYTAAGFGLATDAWHDFIKDDPPLAEGAPTGVDRLVIFGGGYPLKVGGQLVGGIGVSGGPGNPRAADWRRLGRTSTWVPCGPWCRGRRRPPAYEG